MAIILNKNIKKLKNTAIITDITMVIITVLIPVFLISNNIELNQSIIPMFIILYIGCRLLNNSAHKIYLSGEEKTDEVQKNIKKGKNKKSVWLFIIILLVVGIILFIISELLGNTLDNICKLFHISETIVGILLGVITSIPELITFFESQKHYKESERDISGVVEATNNLLTSNIVNLYIIQTIGIFMTRV